MWPKRKTPKGKKPKKESNHLLERLFKKLQLPDLGRREVEANHNKRRGRITLDSYMFQNRLQHNLLTAAIIPTGGSVLAFWYNDLTAWLFIIIIAAPATMATMLGCCFLRYLGRSDIKLPTINTDDHPHDVQNNGNNGEDTQ